MNDNEIIKDALFAYYRNLLSISDMDETKRQQLLNRITSIIWNIIKQDINDI